MKTNILHKHYTVEVTLTEVEIDCLIGLFDQLQMVMQRCEEPMGTRGEIYKALKELRKQATS